MSRTREPVPVDETASGTMRSAEAAVQSTAKVLRWVMGVLLLGFCFSGIFFVEEGTVAIRTNLGRPVGGIREPGGPYFAWPAPIDEVRVISTALKEVALDESFWLPEHIRTLERGEPGWHVALLTADQNIVHARWSAVWRVPWSPGEAAADSAAMRHAAWVGTPARAEELVRAALEQAAIHVVAQTPVDAFLRGEVAVDRVRQLAQQSLDAMHSGIEIASVAMQDRDVPRGVSSAFLDASRAESDRARQIEAAEQKRAARLNAVAGLVFPSLLEAMAQHEEALQSGSPDAVDAARAEIDHLLLGDELGGKASGAIQQALAYRTYTVESVRGAAGRFEAMRAQHDENPAFYRDRQIQDALERIFRGSVETIHLPRDPRKVLYLEVGRN